MARTTASRARGPLRMSPVRATRSGCTRAPNAAALRTARMFSDGVPA